MTAQAPVEAQPLSELVPELGTELRTAEVESADLEVRSLEERIIGARIVAWDNPGDTPIGLESYERGAFSHIDPKKVVLRLEHQDPPAGKGLTLEERADGAYMTFRVSKTLRGDEILTLAADGVTPGVSLSYHPHKTLGRVSYRGGQRAVAITKADLREVSTTWKAMHQQADVLFVRSLPDPAKEKENLVAEPTPPAEPQPAPIQIDLAPLADVFKEQAELQQRSFDAFTDRIAKLEERDRGDFTVPAPVEPKKPTLANWSSITMRMMTGQPVTQKELQERALDDIVTPDNPGLVPDALRTDLLIGIINRRRPFLESTTQITAPDTGMSIVVPVLSQRSTVAVQATEKTEIDSTPMKVTTSSFDAVTIAGGADVSIQMIRRADPSFMDLLIRDLGHDYARKSDTEALEALFAAGTTPGTANIDPEDLLIGEAWENSMTATDEPPDTIWLSAAGVSAFINAKSDGTNAPLYFRLNAAFSVGGGTGGDVSALRPVYVPALDGTSVDVMIGPSSGFAWAEDGAIRLETDNPTKAGRDIALVGILFFIPRYPEAFTTYDLGS
jgi:phage head maturation protease